MFIGHFGLGFGVKKAIPAVSLGTLFIACQFADLLWPTLVLLGLEHVEVQPGAMRMTPLNFVSYPYSHSLLAIALWGITFGAAYLGLRRARVSAAMMLALLVVSHWLLDFVTHRPDLPLTPNGVERFGLGLWSSIPATLVVELSVFAIGIALYVRATSPRDRIGSFALWSLVAFLLVVYVASTFGPPPPNAATVAWSAQAMWLLVAWGYWIENHRTRQRN